MSSVAAVDQTQKVTHKKRIVKSLRVAQRRAAFVGDWLTVQVLLFRCTCALEVICPLHRSERIVGALQFS